MQSRPSAVVVVHYAGNSAPDSDKLKVILGRVITGILKNVPSQSLKGTGKLLPDPVRVSILRMFEVMIGLL